eukprot:2918986-Pyramimonas_sp.AAC.1
MLTDLSYVVASGVFVDLACYESCRRVRQTTVVTSDAWADGGAEWRKWRRRGGRMTRRCEEDPPSR